MAANNKCNVALQPLKCNLMAFAFNKIHRRAHIADSRIIPHNVLSCNHPPNGGIFSFCISVNQLNNETNKPQNEHPILSVQI